MAICILNSPSARMDTPAAMQIKSITPLVRSSTITPRAMSRMPNSRSYWNASRYRSREKYPTSFTAPKAAIAAPSTRPIITAERAGRAMNRTPTTQNTMDMTTYPVLAARMGVTERVSI